VNPLAADRAAIAPFGQRGLSLGGTELSCFSPSLYGTLRSSPGRGLELSLAGLVFPGLMPPLASGRITTCHSDQRLFRKLSGG
jgi:hypothetical protein